MRNDAWLCNNDEHINKNVDTSCEICGQLRPIIKVLKYDLTDVFGKVKIIWELENGESGLLKIKNKEIKLYSTNGELEVENIVNKDSITLFANNKITTYQESLKILLSKPKISFFKSEKEKVLENSILNLTWEVLNAKNVSISNIGKVSFQGNIETKIAKTPYKIIAENDIGKEELLLDLSILPSPKIKDFRSKHKKIEYGKDTQLIWDIENIKHLELHWLGNMEVLSNKGEMTISPTESTNYKLILTALDGTTKDEKLIDVEVFRRIEFKSFTSSSILIPRGLELELDFNVENAQQIVLKSSDGMDQKVDFNQVVKLFPTKSANYWLEARNDLFNSKSETIRVEVDNAPQMSRIPSFFEENQIPLIDLKIPELQSIILDEIQLEFEKMIQPKRSFSISKMLNLILRK
jgi:hypothetical protein